MNATYLCPKCGHAMRLYTRRNGQKMLQCLDRKNCNLHAPAADMPEADNGLSDLKTLPEPPVDAGLAGLRVV